MILGQNPHYVGNVSTQEEKDALIAKYGNQALRPAVKMSKSLGNVVNPDDVVKAYGADTMRLYIMFIGDFEKVATWSDDAVKGCKRFLDRVLEPRGDGDRRTRPSPRRTSPSSTRPSRRSRTTSTRSR